MTQIDRSTGIKGNAGMKLPCRAATTVAITLSGTQTVDGIALVQDDRCLVKNQASSVDNGIYIVDSGTWSRAQDADGVYDFVEGSLVRVNYGTTNADTYWAVSTTGSIVPGTSALVFALANSQLAGVSAIAQSILAASTAAAIQAIIDVPSNAQAVLQALADNLGDMILASADNTFIRKGSGSDGSINIADLAGTGGYSITPFRMRSFAPNPFFQIDQRVNSATSRADDVYGLDRWYTLTQTAAIAVSQMSDQEDGQPFNARLTQTQASAQRMGIACIIEGRDAKFLRGKVVTLTPRIRCSSSQPIRAAILEWTGTMDTVTSDVVNDWTSSTFTAGNFFNSTTLTVNAPSTITPAANTWTDLPGLVNIIGSTTNNIILFIWVEGVAAQNVTFDVGKVRFVEGLYQGHIEMPDFSDELARCQRYYQKTFRPAAVPAQSTGTGGAIKCTVAKAGAVTDSILGNWRFAVTMRTVPSIVTFNTQAANAFARNETKGTDSTAISVDIFENGGIVLATGLAGWAVADVVSVHATAEAEL